MDRKGRREGRDGRARPTASFNFVTAFMCFYFNIVPARSSRQIARIKSLLLRTANRHLIDAELLVGICEDDGEIISCDELLSTLDRLRYLFVSCPTVDTGPLLFFLRNTEDYNSFGPFPLRSPSLPNSICFILNAATFTTTPLRQHGEQLIQQLGDAGVILAQWETALHSHLDVPFHERR